MGIILTIRELHLECHKSIGSFFEALYDKPQIYNKKGFALTLRKVMIMAGGTGGHIYPGIAIAQALQAKQVEVCWLGTQHGLEARLVPEAGLRLNTISIQGVRGKGLLSLGLAPFRIIKACIEALKILSEEAPDVVVGMGGFASGPGGIASFILRKPLLIQEQNAVAGTTNRWLSKWAKSICEAFPNTFPSHPKRHTTGNPLRKNIIEKFQNAPPRTLHSPPCILVVGGSLGAGPINKLMPEVVAHLQISDVPCRVIHQTGKATWEATQKAYMDKDLDGEVELTQYINDMDQALSEADMVICRAGALTVSELSLAGLPAIFVPLPHAIDDHQTANARYVVDQGGGVLMPQSDLTTERLIKDITNILQSDDTRRAMSEAMIKASRPDATDKIVQAIEELVR